MEQLEGHDYGASATDVLQDGNIVPAKSLGTIAGFLVPKRVKDWLWSWQGSGPLQGSPTNDRAMCKPLKKILRLVTAQGAFGDRLLLACIFMRQNSGPPELNRTWSEHRQNSITVIPPLRPKQTHFHLTVGDTREILRHGEAMQIPAATERSINSLLNDTIFFLMLLYGSDRIPAYPEDLTPLNAVCHAQCPSLFSLQEEGGFKTFGGWGCQSPPPSPSH